MTEIPIGEVTVRTRVQMRDRLGRFVAILDAAAVATARELTDKAVELAKQNAPVLSGELREGIRPRYAGKVGYVESTAPHAHPVEKGSIPHQIPGAFGRADGVMHPGNQAQPYLEQVPAQLQPFAPGIAAKHYP
jgi:hypothetical protein